MRRRAAEVRSGIETPLTGRLPRIVVAAVLLVIAWLALNTAIAPKRTTAPTSALVAAALAVAVFAVATWAGRRRRGWDLSRAASPWGRRIAGLVAVITLFVAQLLVAHALRTPHSGWDSEVVTNAVIQGGEGPIEPPGSDYFALYPHNRHLVALLALVLRGAHLLGIHEDARILLILNCLVVCASVVVTTALAHRLLGLRAAVAAGALVTVLVGLSGWTAATYTDTYGVLFPVLTAYCWVRAQASIGAGARYAWVAAGAASLAVGTALRPTTAILAIAVLLVLAYRWLTGPRRVPLGRWLPVALVSVGLVLGTTFAVRAASDHVVPIDEDQAAPVELWMLIGLSYSPPAEVDDPQVDNGVALWGTWNPTDIGLVISAPVDERRDVARDAIKERLDELGPSGYARFLSDKLAFTFVDGTFGIWMDGSNMNVPYPAPRYQDAPLRDLYRGEGAWVSAATIAQACWLLVLGLISRQLWLRWRPELTSAYVVLVVSIGGVIAYQCLFEARSRFLFVFVPFLVLLAAASVRDTRAEATAVEAGEAVTPA